MKKVKTIGLLLSFLMICSIFCSCQEEPHPTADLSKITLNEKQIEEIKTKTDEYLKTNKFSGTGKVTLNEQDVFIQAYSNADSKGSSKNKTDTQYQIGSLTKTFTGIATLQLVNSKKISLNDTLDKYFKGKSYLSQITIQHLLEMRSGLSSYTVDIQNDKTTYNELLKIIKSNPDNTKTKIMVQDFILEKGIEHAIGNFNHSHSDYYLLGLIIEKVSKMPYEEYIEKNIIKPLNLKNTSFININKSFTGYRTTIQKWQSTKDNLFLNSKYIMFSSLGLASDATDINTLYKSILSNEILGENANISCLDIILKSSSDYSCGFYISNNYIYSQGNTYLHSSNSYINTETKEIVSLLSNHNDADALENLTKDVYNITNSKVNGIIFDSIK